MAVVGWGLPRTLGATETFGVEVWHPADRVPGNAVIQEGSFPDCGVIKGWPNQAMRAVAEDREGAIWVATFGGGLARLTLMVQPYFWQTSWFTGVLATALIGVASGTVLWMEYARARLRGTRRELERAKESERVRISRDLHDHLGSTLTEIGMLAGDGTDAATGTVYFQQFQVIREKAKAVVGELDALVWAIDPQHDSLRSLVSYLSGFVEEYGARGGLTVRVQVPDNLPDAVLASEARHNLFLAVKEAVHNAVRHARASSLLLCVEWAAAELVLTITDDGRGFDPGVAFEGHGLSNLRERLALLHGRCEIQSQPGMGTVVTLTVPGLRTT